MIRISDFVFNGPVHVSIGRFLYGTCMQMTVASLKKLEKTNETDMALVA